jgi:small subunit ribosomal protein S2
MSKLDVSPEKLLEAGAHFGHQACRWNPKMKNYIYREEDGVHIIDLFKTKEALEEALKFLKNASKNDKKILFVGTKKQVKDEVKKVAQQCGCCYVNERWLGGTLTNFDQIKISLDKLSRLKKDKAEGSFNSYTKKERILIDREIDRLERFFGGLNGLNEPPDVLIIIDLKKEKGAALEARRKGIETVGIVDTNSDPDLVDYVVPMNDDAGKALDYVLGKMKEAIEEGKKKRKTDKKNDSGSKISKE